MASPPLSLALLLLLPSRGAPGAGPLWVDRYAASYDRPANASSPVDAAGWQLEPPSWSGMPLGDGDTVSLTSVDSNGQLGFLLGKADAYDEFHELLKVGRVISHTQPSFCLRCMPGSSLTECVWRQVLIDLDPPLAAAAYFS